ncbi:MAG: hypothetical protein ACYTEZ_14610 [Planctomycetota bacterium]|jgi:hypothetical protein
MSKKIVILVLLLGAGFAAAQDAEERKAARIAAQGRKRQEATKEVWKRFVFAYRDLSDTELETIVKNYEKAVDLYQKSIEVRESASLNHLILILAKRIAQARMVQTARELQRRSPPARPPPEPAPREAPAEKPAPREAPAEEPTPPPAPERKPETPPAAEPERAPPPEPGELPKLEETGSRRRLGIQGVRNFLMHYYFASRKQSALVSRCPVCNGRGRRQTHVLDRRRRVVTIPCSSCNQTGGHLNVPAARKGYWLCWSPLYRSDGEKQAAWQQRLALWRSDPNKIEEFLKTLKIVKVDYWGLWAEVTWEEKVRPMGAKRSFPRAVTRKVVRAGKRWFFYDEKLDRAFFATDDAEE